MNNISTYRLYIKQEVRRYAPHCRLSKKPEYLSLKGLTTLLEDDSTFGFIVMDGKEALFGTLSGNNKEVINRIRVDLPKKHGLYFMLYMDCKVK